MADLNYLGSAHQINVIDDADDIFWAHVLPTGGEKHFPEKPDIASTRVIVRGNQHHALLRHIFLVGSGDEVIVPPRGKGWRRQKAKRQNLQGVSWFTRLDHCPRCCFPRWMACECPEAEVV